MDKKCKGCEHLDWDDGAGYICANEDRRCVEGVDPEEEQDAADREDVETEQELRKCKRCGLIADTKSEYCTHCRRTASEGEIPEGEEDDSN